MIEVEIMCGRYFFQMEQDQAAFQHLWDHWNTNELDTFQEGEVFPTQQALVLLPSIPHDYSLTVMKWGIHGYQNRLIINARSVGIQEKYTFRPYIHNRCVIVANGFYEWQRNGHAKTKYYIQFDQEPLMYMAGIYNSEQAFVIITKEAQNEMARIHHRMPILMNKSQMLAYLHQKPFQEKKEIIIQAV